MHWVACQALLAGHQLGRERKLSPMGTLRCRLLLLLLVASLAPGPVSSGGSEGGGRRLGPAELLSGVSASVLGMPARRSVLAVGASSLSSSRTTALQATFLRPRVSTNSSVDGAIRWAYAFCRSSGKPNSRK